METNFFIEFLLRQSRRYGRDTYWRGVRETILLVADVVVEASREIEKLFVHRPGTQLWSEAAATCSATIRSCVSGTANLMAVHQEKH
jgi:hypothetical protein